MAEYELDKRDFEPQKFTCRVCSKVVTDPATLPCGHTFCSKCVTEHWDGEDRQPQYTCPQCRQKFSPRPVLVPNTAMTFTLKQNSEGKCFAGPRDITCDLCYGPKKHRATMSCLSCWLSFCESHLEVHAKRYLLKRHTLVAPRDDLHNNNCPLHHQPITLCCVTDGHRVCSSCSATKHKSHTLITANEEMGDRKLHLIYQMGQLDKRLEYNKEELGSTGHVLQLVKAEAELELKNCDGRYEEALNLMEKRRSDMEKKIKVQKQTTQTQFQTLQGSLEQELSELKRQQAELDSLSLAQDPTQILQKYEQLSELKEQPHSVIDQMHLCFTEELTEALSDIPHKLQNCTNMGLALTQNPLLLQQPITREQYLKYAINITMDPNTAHKRLVLSEENRKVTVVKEEQKYPNHPERFSHRWQVLSKKALTGQCYFEVECGDTMSFLGFTYKRIQRKKDVKESALGYNCVSWALKTGISNYIWHNGDEMQVRNTRQCEKIGVFLDHPAGVISFYGIKPKEMFHFGHVQTSFREPLYVAAGFTFCDVSIKFVKLK